LEVPAIEHLHLVGDRPVLTYWGFRDAGRPPLALSASIPPPPPTAGEAPMSARRLPWAWLAILPLLLLFLAVWYFVGLPPGAPPGPPPDAVLPAPLPTPSAAPPAPVAPDERPAIPPQPEPVAPADPSPPPEPAPPPQPAPAPAPVQAGPPPAIDIPKAAWDGHDLRLLEGCWMLGRDVPVVLTSNGPDEPGMEHADRLCFDSSGHGTRKALAIFPSQTITCEAPITTTFSKNGHLHTRQPDVLCTGTTPATKWRARTLDCTRQADGTADCVGVSGAGKAHFLFHRAPD